MTPKLASRRTWAERVNVLAGTNVCKWYRLTLILVYAVHLWNKLLALPFSDRIVN